MRSRIRALLSVGFAVLGVGLIGYLVSRVGLAQLTAALTSISGWGCLVFALEGARIGADALTSQMLYAAMPHGRRARWSRLVLASLAAFPVVLLLPAGRLGGELVKAAALRREVGLPRVATAAVLMQAYPLLGGAVVSVPCVAAAWFVWGGTALTGAIALQLLTAVALGGFIIWAARRQTVSALINKVSKRFGAASEEVRSDVVATGALQVRPLLAAVLGRVLLAAQLVVIAYAVGVPRGVVGGLLTVGLHFVGQAAGDVVPAQLGATDGALVVGAGALGADAAALVAGALVFHFSQLLWAGIGAIVGAFIGAHSQDVEVRSPT